jgi:hypothetical protein
MSEQKDSAVTMSQTIGHKVSVSALLPGVSVSLNERPYPSFDIVVFSPAGEEPSDLYSGLRAVGFNPGASVADASGAVRQTFGRTGSAMLGGWTGPERERFIGEARRTLRRFGFTLVPEIPHPASKAR